MRRPADAGQPAIWTEKTVSTNVGAGGDAISYENGHWFRTYRDATSAHILVSDNGETWTEWPIPQNFWTDSTTLTSRIVAANAVKYYNNQYVCSVLVLCATTSGTKYSWGVLFAREVFNAFQIDSPGVFDWYDSDRVEDFIRYACRHILGWPLLLYSRYRGRSLRLNRLISIYRSAYS